MIQPFFAALIALTSVLLGIYSYFFDKKNLALIPVFMIFSYISLFYWYLAILIIFGFIFYKQLSYASFASLNMFAAILISWFSLRLFLRYDFPYFFYVALAAVILICILAVFGIFENKLKKYLLISSAIQIIFVILDLSVAKMFGKLDVLGTVQIFNYTFAGLALFLAVGVFAVGKKYIYELEGSFFVSRWNDAFATIACLSLAGLPAFNMFVSEWVLFTTSFATAPMIAILGIFAALLLFIMYYKIVYVLLVGEGKRRSIPKPVTIVNGFLAILCLLFGLFPDIQWEILTKVGV